MFYVFLLAVAAIGVGVYLTFVFQNVPGMKEERLGTLEPLPADLGTWKADSGSESAQAASREGLIREVRLFYDEQRGRLVEQVRYRRESDSEIVRVEPDRRVKRRRVRPA
jgi:hypothetical protein